MQLRSISLRFKIAAILFMALLLTAGSLMAASITHAASKITQNGASIVTGPYQTFELKPDGTVWAWGKNDYGQLGDGTKIDRSQPVQVMQAAGVPLSDVIAVSSGYWHTIALKSDGSLWSWGRNNYGQLGDGTSTDRLFPVQVKESVNSSPIQNVKAIATGHHHTVILKSDGTVWSWGRNNQGQLGDGSLVNRKLAVQVKASNGTGTLSDITVITSGYYHTAAVRSNGRVFAWGLNDYGQLGDGTTENRSLPIEVRNAAGTGALTNIISVSTSYYHTVALHKNGTVWSWGRNNYGQLGDGTTTDRHHPVQASGIAAITAIASGYWHTAAVKTDGTLWGWGRNNYSQLGDGTTSTRSRPIQVKGLNGAGFLSGVKSITSGDYHISAMTSDGAIWAWGRNDFGQLGFGNGSVQSTPKRVKLADPGAAGFVSIATGRHHSVGLKADGTVWSWGLNDYGQLGDGTIVNSSVPVAVKGLKDVVAVSTGYWHTVALKHDGSVWSWGRNNYGQLGDGTTTTRKSPVQVRGSGGSGTLSSIVQVSVGYHYSLALKSDGTVWSWGRNEYGQLGNGTFTNSSNPVQVKGANGSGNLTGITRINAGNFHVAAINNGAIWTWGRNEYGQLGIGNFDHSSTPVQLSTSGTNGLSGIIQVSPGGLHTVALKSNGTVWAWGRNDGGQLGQGTAVDSLVPVQVGGSMPRITKIASGYNFSAGIAGDGSIWGWGRNTYGQLGDGTTTVRRSPIKVKGINGAGSLSSAVSISAGNDHLMVLRSTGTMWSWGRNDMNQLGNRYLGATQKTPALVSLSDAYFYDSLNRLIKIIYYRENAVYERVFTYDAKGNQISSRLVKLYE